jgi:hypothetical protein
MGAVTVRKDRIGQLVFSTALIITTIIGLSYIFLGMTTVLDAGGSDSDIDADLQMYETEFMIDIDADVRSVAFSVHPMEEGEMEVFLYRDPSSEHPYWESTPIRSSILTDSIVSWEVGRDEIDGDILILVYDNTNTGELNQTPDLNPYTRTEVTINRNPAYNPLFWVMVVLTIIVILLVHRMYVNWGHE